MTDLEIVMNTKQAYDRIEDLIENIFIEELNESEYDITKKEYNVLEKSLNVLENIYDRAYEKITDEEKKTSIKCKNCGNLIEISDVINYAYVCQECDENFYSFEVEVL